MKPIEEVKVGEKVKSFNERTGQTSYEPVLELMQHDGTFQLVKVTLDSGESLEATAGHPFYVQGKGWNVAANLKVGEALRLHNGVTLVIKTVETSTRFAKVYNFAVAQNANYFVGEDGVGVHNAKKCGGSGEHDKQKKGKPKSNTRQNKQVDGAAREAGLDPK